MVDDDALNGRWAGEQALLGLDRNTPDEEFARGGLASFAVDPTAGCPLGVRHTDGMKAAPDPPYVRQKKDL